MGIAAQNINVARRLQNFDCKESYPTETTQMTAKFGCYVKHSSLQKGVFRHKIVKTLRKGSNHPPRCKQKTKTRLFCVAVPLGTCRQRNRGGKIGKAEPKTQNRTVWEQRKVSLFYHYRYCRHVAKR